MNSLNSTSSKVPSVPSARVATRVSHPRSTLWLLAALLPLALLLAALLWPARANSAERYTLSGRKIAVYNLAGTMVIESASGSEAVVEAMLAGRDQGKLKIATGRIDERQTLRVLYPGNSIVYPQYGRGSSTTTRVRDDGTFGGKDSNLWPSGRRVRISGSGWGGGVEAHADLKLLVPKGCDVIVRLAVGDMRVSNVDSKLFLDTGSGAVVSSGTSGGLAIDTGSGSVRVARADGPVSIDTGSGGVSVHETRGGNLVIDTGSGDVDASAIDTPMLSVDTGSGHVELDGVSARSVHIDTGSGGVTVGLRSIVEELNIDSGSGSVEVQMPRETGAMLSLQTGSGGLDVDMPLTNLRRDHGELYGQMGDGKGRIVIETGSGGIHIGGR
jgi:lia operon protein LiaG